MKLNSEICISNARRSTLELVFRTGFNQTTINMKISTATRPRDKEQARIRQRKSRFGNVVCILNWHRFVSSVHPSSDVWIVVTLKYIPLCFRSFPPNVALNETDSLSFRLFERRRKSSLSFQVLL